MNEGTGQHVFPGKFGYGTLTAIEGRRSPRNRVREGGAQTGSGQFCEYGVRAKGAYERDF